MEVSSPDVISEVVGLLSNSDELPTSPSLDVRRVWLTSERVKEASLLGSFHIFVSMIYRDCNSRESRKR